MSNIPQYVCGVIPPHILTRVAERTDDATGDDARATLEHMRELATGRARTLIEGSPAAPSDTTRKRRNVYDARHQHRLPGKLAMSEHKPRSADVEVNEAYDGSGATHDFYAQLFGRRSIDGKGMRLDSTVHYGTRFENAMWNGRQMVYGDGDGRIFNRFTASLDVIGHELTHGVTQFSTALGYSGQTGALNEHLSDAFGAGTAGGAGCHRLRHASRSVNVGSGCTYRAAYSGDTRARGLANKRCRPRRPACTSTPAS